MGKQAKPGEGKPGKGANFLILLAPKWLMMDSDGPNPSLLLPNGPFLPPNLLELAPNWPISLVFFPRWLKIDPKESILHFLPPESSRETARGQISPFAPNMG